MAPQEAPKTEQEAPEAALDQLETDMARRQRRRWILGLCLGGVVVAVGVLAFLFWPRSPEPRCDKKQAAEFLANATIPGEALGRVCRLPAPLDEALRGGLGAPPAHRPLLAFQLVARHPELLTRVCANAVQALPPAIAAPRAEQSAHFLRACPLGKTHIASEDALARVPLHRLLLAIAVFGSLRDSDPKLAPRLARRMLSEPEAEPGRGVGYPE